MSVKLKTRKLVDMILGKIMRVENKNGVRTSFKCVAFSRHPDVEALTLRYGNSFGGSMYYYEDICRALQIDESVFRKVIAALLNAAGRLLESEEETLLLYQIPRGAMVFMDDTPPSGRGLLSKVGIPLCDVLDEMFKESVQ